MKKYGIEGTVEVLHNPSYDELYKEETLPGHADRSFDDPEFTALLFAAPAAVFSFSHINYKSRKIKQNS